MENGEYQFRAYDVRFEESPSTKAVCVAAKCEFVGWFNEALGSWQPMNSTGGPSKYMEFKLWIVSGEAKGKMPIEFAINQLKATFGWSGEQFDDLPEKMEDKVFVANLDEEEYKGNFKKVIKLPMQNKPLSANAIGELNKGLSMMQGDSAGPPPRKSRSELLAEQAEQSPAGRPGADEDGDTSFPY